MARLGRSPFVLSLALVGAILGQPAGACPFCSAVQLTFSEEITANDVAVIVTLKERPETPEGSDSNSPFATPAGAEAKKCTFELNYILKGADELEDTKHVEALYFGQEAVGSHFLIFAVILDEKPLAWKTPIALSKRGVDYILNMAKLPESGADRLAYFQDYLEDQDPVLAVDAYDEFARAPYADVIALKDRMNHDKLVEWVMNSEISSSRRRLYLTMLGACGTSSDADVLEELIKSTDGAHKVALDAMIAAYLNLRGPEGLPLIVDLYLKNKDAEYTDTYSAVMALRFHGQERDVISKDDLKAAMRHMLDRPQLADLVIPDLARWQDWSVMDKLVELFKNADDQSAWVRVPVINYLQVCPLPEAKAKIEELRKIDPDAVRRASSMLLPLAGKAAKQPAGAQTKEDGLRKENDAAPAPASAAK